MAARADIQQGLRAELTSSRAAVIQACERAVLTLGTHARCHYNAAQITVEILPANSPALSKVSPIVGIALARTPDGRVSVRTNIDRCLTHQSRRFGVLPFGPKCVVGQQYYVMLLNALEHELLALDPSTAAVQWDALAG